VRRFSGYWSKGRPAYVCPVCQRGYFNKEGIFDALGSDGETEWSRDKMSSFASAPTKEQGWADSCLRLRTLLSLTRLNSKTHSGLFLDVGCGYGAMLSAARPHFGLVAGVNMDRQELEKTKELLCREGAHNVALFHASAQNLPFMPGQFAAVTCVQVLEHTSEPRVVLSQLKQMMGPGGYLYLSVPNRSRSGGNRTASCGESAIYPAG